MKLAPYGIYIRKWKLTRVGAIRQQDKNALRFGFNPKTRSRKTEMPEAVFRERV